jgi:hypothetical protein
MGLNSFVRLGLFAALITPLVVACNSAPKVTEVSREERQLTIVGIDQPRGYYLDLHDTKENRRFQRVYIAKRCSEFRRYPVGTTVKTSVIKLSDGANKVDAVGLRKMICGY